MSRSEEHTSELQSLRHLVCRLLLEKKKKKKIKKQTQKQDTHMTMRTPRPLGRSRCDSLTHLLHLSCLLDFFSLFFFFFFLITRPPPNFPSFPPPAFFRS